MAETYANHAAMHWARSESSRRSGNGYQVLTKRPDRLRDLLSSAEFADVAGAEHILWGVSVEDRKYGFPRIEILRSTRVRRRFLSIEPLLEDLGDIDLSGIHWVIVGGESGPGARPFALEWAASLIASARRYAVPVFIKQMGRKPTLDGVPFPIFGQDGGRDAKGKTVEAWPEHLRVRDFPVFTPECV
jgi:protein gp37